MRPSREVTRRTGAYPSVFGGHTLTASALMRGHTPPCYALVAEPLSRSPAIVWRQASRPRPV